MGVNQSQLSKFTTPDHTRLAHQKYYNLCTSLKSTEKILSLESNYEYSLKSSPPNPNNTQIYKKILRIYKNNNLILECEYQNNNLNGFGVIYDPEKSLQTIYKGYFSNGLYHGWGIDSVYEGQFQNGKRSGWGFWKDKGFSYNGMWANDLFEGKGCYKLNFIGQWSQGLPQGLGLFKSQSQIYQGYFKKGLYEGEGKLIQGNIVKVGKFCMGQKVANN